MRVINNLAVFFSRLYENIGFWGASSVFILIGLFCCFFIIKKRFFNVYISNSLREELQMLKENGDTEIMTNVLLKNGFSMFGIVYVSLVKIIFGLLYGYVLRSDALAFLDLGSGSYPWLVYGYKTLTDYGPGKFYIIGFSLLYAGLQLMINRSISKDSCIDTDVLDLIMLGVVFVICIVFPGGTLAYIFCFTVIECCVTMLNLYSWLKKRNQEIVDRRLVQFKQSFKESYKPKKMNQRAAQKKRQKRRK